MFRVTERRYIIDKNALSTMGMIYAVILLSCTVLSMASLPSTMRQGIMPAVIRINDRMDHLEQRLFVVRPPMCRDDWQADEEAYHKFLCAGMIKEVQ